MRHRLGKPQQFISNVERNERRLDVVEYYAFVRALGAWSPARYIACKRGNLTTAVSRCNTQFDWRRDRA